MKKVYLIPNVITAFSLSCGLFVIFKTSTAIGTGGLFMLLQAAAILLLIAAVADLADGAVARLIKAESEFGGQFDSLSDSVTFGIAPPLLVLKSLFWGGESPGRFLIFLVIMSAMIYSLCGVLRLVRYNIHHKIAAEGAEQAVKKDEKKHFTGLPIPAAASAVLSAALILVSPLAENYFPLTVEQRTITLSVILILIGYFMISRWKFPSVKALHFRVPSFYLVFATGILAVVLLYGILDYFPEVYFILSWLYLLISLSLSIIRLIAGKRSATLADFEPDDE